MNARLVIIESKMKKVVSGWLAGAINGRQFNEALLMFSAAIDEPKHGDFKILEEAFDGLIDQAGERIRSGDLWHEKYQTHVKASLARVFA